MRAILQKTQTQTLSTEPELDSSKAMLFAQVLQHFELPCTPKVSATGTLCTRIFLTCALPQSSALYEPLDNVAIEKAALARATVACSMIGALRRKWIGHRASVITPSRSLNLVLAARNTFFFLLEVLCGFPSLPSFADGNVCSPELSRPGVCSTGRACTGQTVHANVIVQIHRWSGSEPKKNERFPSLAPPRRGQLGQTWSASSFSFFLRLATV